MTTERTSEQPPDPVAPAETRRSRRRKRRRRRHDPPDMPPIELELTGFAPGGKAVGHAPDGRVAFVEYGLPGEHVVAHVTEEHPSFLEARTTAVREPSPHRIEPRCQYFGRCGGCQLQHVQYEQQLRLKTAVVREQLERIGGFEQPPLREMIGMDEPWAYRNHMRFTARLEGYVGFMERGTHRFLRVEHCPIAVDRINGVLEAVQDATTGTRQIAIRAGELSDDLLVQPTLQWRDGHDEALESGQTWYSERLLGRDFRISAAAFFQVNTRQAERLARLVIERVEAAKPEVAVDAYSGVGTFAALLAPSVPLVLAIEESAAAGADAEANLDGLDNVTMLVGRVEEMLPDLSPAPDVVVIDPPRAGMRREVVEAMLTSAVRRLVYVSCDPATLSRDLRLLVDGGFVLDEVQPVDMFPQTQHIECVTTLDRLRPR
ncbi:MAG: class I SAM-dependent RNA methyltransferase [Dehalococcoidia bacterium]|nr:class I SAM-dependent RNA methyltransferase [Dehalococcoidia bacterium]